MSRPTSAPLTAPPTPDAALAPGAAPAANRRPASDVSLRSWSLRGRMLAIGLGVAVLAWVAGGLAFYLAAAQADAERRDARLVHLAQTLAAFAEHELAEIAPQQAGPITSGEGHVERAAAMDGRYLYQIWQAHDQRLLLRSHDAPSALALVPAFRPGLGDGELAGQVLRTYAMAAGAGQLQVQVAERLVPHSAMGDSLGPGLVAAMLLSLAAVAALAVWLVMRALQPVRALAHRLGQRQPMDADPIEAADLPAEMQPLVTALNSLLVRIGERLSRERGFTAVAAHELRTPLAALRLQAQVAQRETDPERRDRQLSALTALIDRCDRLLTQLLNLARLDQDQTGVPPEPLALDALIDEVLHDLAPLITRRQARVTLQLQAGRIVGRRESVQMLLSNLIENALLHGGVGAQVTVTSRHHDGGTDLQVDDSGPGIPAAERTRVFDRFVRLQRATGTPGSGLGLSIVRTVAEAHGAQVRLLDAPGGGLRVQISFPDAPARAGSPPPAP